MNNQEISTIQELKRDFVLENVLNICEQMFEKQEKDFTTKEGWRFIHEDNIDKVMCDELKSQPYSTLAYSDNLIGKAINTDGDIVGFLKTTPLGQKLLINKLLSRICKFQQELYYCFGYGPHFSADGVHRKIGSYYCFALYKDV